MSSLARWILIASLAGAIAVPAAGYDGIGRPATAKEVSAWDIDVRPDFAGLPAGSGSVAKGEQIWDAQCASCHGTFGESNEVFTPLAGGTTKEDRSTGHVKALAGNSVPQRTTLMKLATVSTLFDYIRRAMPWNAPKSLAVNEVYAATAYVLFLNDIVPADFVLDQNTIRDVQQRLPNRNGMTRDHGLWDTQGKPDTANKPCMKKCVDGVTIASRLPDHARTAHGNLADQNRMVGPVRGIMTVEAAQSAAPKPPSQQDIAEANGCLACHGISEKMVGPSFREIAGRYHDKKDAADQLVAKVRAGGAGSWGDMPMPPQEQLDDKQTGDLVRWILDGAK